MNNQSEIRDVLDISVEKKPNHLISDFKFCVLSKKTSRSGFRNPWISMLTSPGGLRASRGAFCWATVARACLA